MPAYYFISELTELDPKEIIHINEEMTIKLADEKQIETIRSLLTKYGEDPRGLTSKLFQEYKIKERLPSGGINRTRRSPDDYRYFLLEHDSPQYEANILKVFQLMENEFFIPFGFAYADFGTSIFQPLGELATFVYYNDQNIVFPLGYPDTMNLPKDPKTFEENDLIEFRTILTVLRTFNFTDFPIIEKSLSDFFKVNEISNNSIFKIVSYFACLELLIVNSNDRLNYITQQLETKLELLNNRFSISIEINDYLKGPDTLTLGKVISVMYSYRSSIAHGDFLDFNKRLKILEKTSIIEIQQILRLLLKRLLIFALEEPQLITDLKKC